MVPIKPHLWFNHEVKQATQFYTTLLPNSAVNYTNYVPGPGGDCDVVEFTLARQPFLGINGGPYVKVNPSISFMIHFDDVDKMGQAWDKLIIGGTAMMPLGKYPFSERYGWVADKYGVSWQLMLKVPDAAETATIIPSLMFTEAMAGKANEALDVYCAIFKDGRRGTTAPRMADMGPDKAGTLLYADFYINGTWLAAMDSAHPHGFAFNDAVSLLVTCDTQAEVDYYWDALTAGGQPGQCGWLKDKFGVSWQVTSSVMFDAIKNGSREQINRVVKAFTGMQKVDVAALQQAFATE